MTPEEQADFDRLLLIEAEYAGYRAAVEAMHRKPEPAPFGRDMRTGQPFPSDPYAAALQAELAKQAQV